jgi:hypothetical protein
MAQMRDRRRHSVRLRLRGGHGAQTQPVVGRGPRTPSPMYRWDPAYAGRMA